MDSRQDRVAKNEALFREVNERIREIHENLGELGRSDFLCECGNEDCTAPISLSQEEYERVRSEPTHFVIAPGHENIDLERVVEKTTRYEITEKFPGPPAQEALNRDPRPS